MTKKIYITNEDIRAALASAGFKQWQLADRIGMPETSLCRLLRYELPENKKKILLDTLKQMEAEREGA